MYIGALLLAVLVLEFYPKIINLIDIWFQDPVTYTNYQI